MGLVLCDISINMKNFFKFIKPFLFATILLIGLVFKFPLGLLAQDLTSGKLKRKRPDLSPVRDVNQLNPMGATSVLTQKNLKNEIANRLMKVPEFLFIKEKAEALGIKAYLFGGTAAAYAHYVYWDLLREKGDTSFQPGS